MPGRTILITGASSGLGAALARAYARAGDTLLLWGRDEDRLAATASQCRALGAVARVEAFDLRDVDGLVARLASRDAETPIDLAIFCAGVGGSVPRDHPAEAPHAAQMMAQVNFTVPVVGASALAGAMAQRRRGQIVLVGSIAESFPLPMAPAYAGAKAGLAMFAEALGIRMAPHGVTVTLVSPGFIDTPMSRQIQEHKPFLMSADHAARLIMRKIERRATRIVVPWQFAVLRAVSKLLPRPFLRRILRGAL
jgi:short-subunit dehydrogenase